MPTIQQQNMPTLSERLGEAAHVSPLLRMILQLSGCNEAQIGEWLLKCAVLRGATHYRREFGSDLPPDARSLKDEELGVALCLGQHVYDATLIRAAAQFLSSRKINPARLGKLAEMERAEFVLLHIARCAERFAPEAEPWGYLREHLRPRRRVPAGTLPHWSRFVSQTGVTPFGGGPDIKWLFRQE